MYIIMFMLVIDIRVHAMCHFPILLLKRTYLETLLMSYPRLSIEAPNIERSDLYKLHKIRGKKLKGSMKGANERVDN
jgi:hypothetical protein